jgi:hypothetical protein
MKHQVLCKINRPALLFVMMRTPMSLYSLRIPMFQMLTLMLILSVSLRMVTPPYLFRMCPSFLLRVRMGHAVYRCRSCQLSRGEVDSFVICATLILLYSFECRCLVVTLTPIPSRSLLCLLLPIGSRKTRNTSLIISGVNYFRILFPLNDSGTSLIFSSP